MADRDDQRGQPGAQHEREVAGHTVTMQDIARVSGVSQSTVSRVLNDRATTVPIAAVTRERVLEAADRLGYRPNPLARGLRGAKTMLLGIIVREIADPFFAPAVEAVSMRARERSYNVVLGSAHSQADEAIELHAVLETRHCDGIILLGDMRDQPRLLDDLAASHGSGGRPVAGRGASRRRHRERRQPRRRRRPRSIISPRSVTGGSGSSARACTVTSGSGGPPSSTASPRSGCGRSTTTSSRPSPIPARAPRRSAG